MSAKSPSRPDQARNLLARGLLHEEPSGAEQAEMFLKEAGELLAAAKLEAIPLSVRYRNTYDAVFAIAMAGLRRLDLRPSQKEGSRNAAIGSLAWTSAASVQDMPVLFQANQRRADATYRAGSMSASAAEVKALLTIAERLLSEAKRCGAS